jgi:hypothetical protein
MVTLPTSGWSALEATECTANVQTQQMMGIFWRPQTAKEGQEVGDSLIGSDSLAASSKEEFYKLEYSLLSEQTRAAGRGREYGRI